MLQNRATGQEVLLATMSSDGRHIDVPNSIDRPLTTAIRETLLYAKPEDIRLTGNGSLDSKSFEAIGMLTGALAILKEVDRTNLADADTLLTASDLLADAADSVLKEKNNA